MFKLHGGFLSPMFAALTAVVGGGLGGCADSDSADAVHPSVALVLSQGALSLAPGTLKAANGTYGAGCTNRSGAWSLEITGASATLLHPPLSVVRGNIGCVLTLTSLTADKDYAANPTFAMGAAYQATSSSFTFGVDPIAFYGNAYLNGLTFASDFVVVILYSDDANVNTADNTANFTVQAATATASGIPAPNYAIDMTTLFVSSDDNDVVVTATGGATLNTGSVTGQDYVVLETLTSTSYADVDAAFKGATSSAISGSIAAAEFTLVAVDLTGDEVRFVILANTINSVPSYQVFTITFHPPTRT